MTILSLVPVPCMPQAMMELSGIEFDGIAAFEADGTVVAPVVNVSTPVEDTLNCETGLPLKLKEKGRVCMGDHAGVVWLGPSMTDQLASRPLPYGYSL